MDNNEEFFYSENPQEIEKEKKKRSALHSLFPNLMGGKTDKTKYVLWNSKPKEDDKNIPKMPTTNTKSSIFLENEQKGFNFENKKESSKQSINILNPYNNINKQKIATPISFDDIKKENRHSFTTPNYKELELENPNKPKQHTITNDSLKFENKQKDNRLDAVSYNDKEEMLVTLKNDSLKTIEYPKTQKKILIYGSTPIKNYDKQINELKQKLPKEALDILNKTGTEIKVMDDLHFMYNDGKRSKQQGIYTSKKIVLNSKNVDYNTLLSETVHAAQDYLGMTNYGKVNLEFQEHVIKDLYNTQRLFKTGDIDFANSYSVSSNYKYNDFIKEIFDNNGDLILDKFLMGISPFIEEFQKNYVQSNSYQNKGVDNYNYNWIELLNIFEIEYK